MFAARPSRPPAAAAALPPPEYTPLRTVAKARALLATGLIAAATATCTDNSITGPGLRLTVSAPTQLLYVNDVEQLTASLASGTGPAGDVVWKSSDTTVATVDVTGLVRAVRAGSASIIASSGRARGLVSITVHDLVKFGVAISPKVDSFYLGEGLQLRATVTDSLGKVRTDRTVAWTLGDTAHATINAAGFVQSKERGTFTVYATSGGLTGAADLKVMRHVAMVAFPTDTVDVALGTARYLEFSLADSSGDPILGRRVYWQTSDIQSVSIDSYGLVHGGAAGGATITATSEGVTSSAYVRVVPRTLARLSLTLPQSWVTVGQNLPAAPIMWDSNGALTDHHAVKWSSSDTTIATVSATGVITGRARGHVAVTVESEGIAAFTGLDVQLPLASLNFTADSVYMLQGQLTNLFTLARDSLGNALQSSAGTWTSSDPNVVTFPYAAAPATATALPLGTGRSLVTATVDGHSATMPVIVAFLLPQYVTWYSDGATVAPFTRYATPVYLRNWDGTAPGEQTMTISSSDTTVAAVTPASARTSADGLVMVTVTARGAGRSVVVATSGTLSAAYVLTVVPVTPTRVTIGNEFATLPVGTSQRLVATVVDAGGVARPFPLRWTTTDASVATVSDSGDVTAVAGGRVSVAVSAGDPVPGAPTDTATFVVSAPSAPTVTGISPAELVPGQSAVISGTGFGTDVASDVVTVDGMRATVTAATATELTVTLPSASSFACKATQPVEVVVSTGAGLVTVASQPLVSAPQRTLAIGEAVMLPAGERCFELTSREGVYLLATSNPARSADAHAKVVVRSDSGIGAVTPAIASRVAFSGPSPTAVSPGGVVPVDLAKVRRAAAEHHHILDANRAIVSRNGAPAPMFARARADAAGNDSLRAMLATTAPSVGSLSYMRVWEPDADACGGYRTIQARTVYVGGSVTIAEDASAPLARKMDDEYRKLGAEFEASMLPLVRANFGDPLAADGQLGLGGRVVLLFTPTVNAMGNVLGYVSGCDFYPTAYAPSSNQAPVLYAIVPTSTASGFTGGLTKDAWRHIIRATVVHETKHLASLSERLARGATAFEESWLEEATAMTAMEIWNRAFTGTTWKGHATYQADLYCEVRPTTSGCVGRPYVMFDHFAFLYDYLVAAESHSPLGGTDYTDATFYGSGWELLRWSVDQYAGSESGFLRSLTQETSLSGVANLEARTGRPFAEMSVDWSATNALALRYGYIQTRRPQLTLPSWNLLDVFNGMAGDFPQYFSGREFPAPARSLYCEDSSTGAPDVRGGSSALFALGSCPGRKLFLDVTTPGGAPTSAELVRIH